MDRLKFRTPYYLPDPDDKDQFIGFEYWNAVDGRPQMMVSWGKDEQCTGLKDKNGNLIYEGDIVIEGCCKGVVKYGTFNCSCCDGVYGWYFDGLNGQTDIRCYEFCEVIGNIHEQKDNK